MTAQIPDKFHYEGEDFDLVGLTGEPLYTPRDFGITTQMASTACWRGYQMIYDCKNGELILDQMYVRTTDKIPVNAVSPKEPEEDHVLTFFNTTYENLGLKTKFTGTLLLANDFISEMYVHMGFQSPDAYRTVLEIHVDDGNITEVKDLSEMMEERRKSGEPIKPSQSDSINNPDVEDWVKDRFSLDYKSE
jgi:hypothetical protein